MIGRRGYMLVETVTAMAILSLVALTVQQAVRTAVQARGLAQDFTTAQFLMESLVADQELQPRVAVGEENSGAFPPPNDRFEYVWTLEEVEVPRPDLPLELSPEQRGAFESSYEGRMGKLHVEIRWTRGGQPFTVFGETLIAPERIWSDPFGTVP